MCDQIKSLKHSKKKKILCGIISCNRTRSNGYKLKYNKFCFNVRKNHLHIVRVSKHWNRLPEEVVECSSLETGQKPNGHSPEETALAGPVLKKGN